MYELRTIKQAIERAVKAVTLRPERGQRTYRNLARVDCGTLCHVEEAGRTLTLDVGKALGGNDQGPNPGMLLRSAMSGCVAIGIRQWAARRNLPIEQVEVQLETDVDARGQLGVCEAAAPGFQRVRMLITVTSAAPFAAIDDLVATSLKYSPLMDLFLNPQPVDHRLKIVAPHATPQHRETA